MQTLNIAYLYPDELNIYGDRGNILTLYRRCEARGIGVVITSVGPGDTLDADAHDLYFMGGGQDAQQIAVCDDLHAYKAAALKAAAETNAVFLTICGGYQLLGHYYKPHEGPELRGLSLIDAHTVAGKTRFIGNVVIDRLTESTGGAEAHGNEAVKRSSDEPLGVNKIVGFENHSGLTYLGQGVQPLGKVIKGHGNHGQDGYEGVCHGNLYGTYLHGSLLPKNPKLADELIAKALMRRYGSVELAPLEDTLEVAAHTAALQLRS